MDINEIDDFNDDLIEDSNQSEEQYEGQSDSFTHFEDDEYEDYEDEGNPNFAEDEEVEEPDIIESLLRSKGINPEAIKFETENGYEEVPFDELSYEEKMQILNSSDLDDDYGLDDDEINLINQLRSNNWKISDYNNYIASQAINNYNKQQEGSASYQVDDISDEELYLIDLKSRVPDISEDDAMQELDLAKQNMSIFNAKVDSIRDEYKQREDAMNEQQAQEAARQREEQNQYFTNQVINAINANSSIDIGDSAIELSNEDKNDIASFILDTDQAGVRHIAKALNDPNTVVNMVWYALKGKEAFREVSNYYKQQITEVAKRNYNKGYEDAKSGRSSNSAKAIVKRQRKNAPSNRELTINDLD